MADFNLQDDSVQLASTITPDPQFDAFLQENKFKRDGLSQPGNKERTIQLVQEFSESRLRKQSTKFSQIKPNKSAPKAEPSPKLKKLRKQQILFWSSSVSTS
jgi:hypothetical protein